MDALALRLANRIVGNEEGAAALEMTVTGATLRFDADAVIALTGARMDAALDGKAMRILATGARRAWQCARARTHPVAGQRAYLAVRGSFDIPEYLGSRATSRSGSSAATAAARCMPATCCG
jgi:urea carboxylase